MNLSKEIKKEIDSLISSLIDIGICDDQNFTAIKTAPEYIKDITFSEASDLSNAFDKVEYSEIYKELLTKRAFTLKLLDGALIQMMYRTKHDELSKHRLVFYPSPSLLSFQNAPNDYMQEDNFFLDIVSRKIVPFPLRFDFDMDARCNISHPACHLTLGDVKGCRIPVSSPLSPIWFIKFILCNFYNTGNHDFAQGLPKNNGIFRDSRYITITEDEKKLVHLNVPL